MIHIVFVCLGNICRSPVAEGLFLDKLKNADLEKKFKIDSAGTSAYHLGSPPDKRMRETAFQHGVTLEHEARQLEEEDFHNFDYIVAMDKSNFEDITAIKPDDSKAKIVMMRDYDPEPEDGDVPDPYFGGIEGFENVFQIVSRSQDRFLEALREEFNEN